MDENESKQDLPSSVLSAPTPQAVEHHETQYGSISVVPSIEKPSGTVPVSESRFVKQAGSATLDNDAHNPSSSHLGIDKPARTHLSNESSSFEMELVHKSKKSKLADTSYTGEDATNKSVPMNISPTSSFIISDVNVAFYRPNPSSEDGPPPAHSKTIKEVSLNTKKHSIHQNGSNTTQMTKSSYEVLLKRIAQLEEENAGIPQLKKEYEVLTNTNIILKSNLTRFDAQLQTSKRAQRQMELDKKLDDEEISRLEGALRTSRTMPRTKTTSLRP